MAVQMYRFGNILDLTYKTGILWKYLIVCTCTCCIIVCYSYLVEQSMKRLRQGGSCQRPNFTIYSFVHTSDAIERRTFSSNAGSSVWSVGDRTSCLNTPQGHLRACLAVEPMRIASRLEMLSEYAPVWMWKQVHSHPGKRTDHRH